MKSNKKEIESKCDGVEISISNLLLYVQGKKWIGIDLLTFPYDGQAQVLDTRSVRGVLREYYCDREEPDGSFDEDLFIIEYEMFINQVLSEEENEF